MSGYITGTGSESFDRAYDWVGKDRKTRQAVGVDAAIREGVGEMMQRGGAGGYQPPMAQPWAGSVYSPPGAPQAAPTASPAAPAAAAPRSPAMTPAPAQAAPGSFLQRSTLYNEDPTGRKINPWGHTGGYQFGTGALKDAGLYEPSPGEDLRVNQWTGMIVSPRTGKRYTHAQFAANEDGIQEEAWSAHQDRLGREIDRLGLRQYIGQNIGGQVVTEDTIRAAMHFAGVRGATDFFTSGGAHNPNDKLGTTVTEYLRRIAGWRDDGAAAPGGAAPSVGGMGLFAPQGGAEPAQGGFNARMDPILSRLAQTPGGGATALSVLGSQSRYDMAQGRRNDAYQRLAMQALGKGDIGVFQYYARIGGLNIPQEIVANAGARQRLAVGSLTAERLYRASPQQAAVFTQAYMQTGNIGQAFLAAGPPPDNPKMTVAQVYDAETNTVSFLGIKTTGPDAGQATQITTPDGAPVNGAPKPANARQPDRVVRLQMLRAAGFDKQTANAIAAGSRPTPSTISNVQTRVAKMVQDDYNYPTAAAKDAEVENRMSAMFGPDWRSQMRGAPTVQPNAPAGDADPYAGLGEEVQ